MVRYVIDTGVFYRPRAMDLLSRTRLDIIVPVVVYMERVRQLKRAGREPRVLDELLALNELEVEPFMVEHALRYAAAITDDRRWRRLFRDAMIAGHVGPDDILWTTNPKDFLALGLEAHQVVGV